jgi:hypothetical protein
MYYADTYILILKFANSVITSNIFQTCTNSLRIMLSVSSVLSINICVKMFPG